jgi:hypothetical protein
MKNLALFLLLALSTPAFAQKNELVLSSGYISYHAYNPSRFPRILLVDLNGNGYQLSLYYLHNMNLLQVGGGVEFGQLSANHEEVTVQSEGPNGVTVNTERMEHYAIADPYIAGNVQVNFRLPLKKWTFYAGGSMGYIKTYATSIEHNPSKPGWEGEGDYGLGGIYKGAQAGATCKLLPNLALSADIMGRFANLKKDAYSLTEPYTLYNRLEIYNFALGVRYRF